MQSLYTKLSLALLALLLLVSAANLGLTLFITQRYNDETIQKLNVDLAEHLVADQLLIEEGEVQQDALKQAFHMLMVINPSIELYLLDPDGEILAFSAPPGKVVREQVDLEPVRRFIAGDARLPLFGDDPRAHGREKVFSAAPIRTDGGGLQGYLYVVLGGEQYDSAAQMVQGSYILRLGVWWLGASLLLTLLVGLLLFHYLTRRVRWLVREVVAFEDSEFRRPIPPAPRPVAYRDEIDRLSVSFREMAARITEQLERLESTDALRRELVANVSHDLRTPLASLRGYIETLQLRRDRLTPEERERYLEIAARHAERLGRLIDDLFELTKLEHGPELHAEPFALADLVQDVVLKCQLEADRRSVRLDVEPSGPMPRVYGDIRLVERVIENLVANALRHTAEGGRVRVELRSDDRRVHVRVTDTGSGIPPEELPRIFDRFSRNRSGGHGSGLGLAISKRAVELHGGTLDVESTPGQGSVFRFDLPLAV
jgi:signal transduction histidine kinase